MAYRNLEEALVARIHRALAKELKRLRRTPRAQGNGHATGRALTDQATVVAKKSSRQERREDTDAANGGETLT